MIEIALVKVLFEGKGIGSDFSNAVVNKALEMGISVAEARRRGNRVELALVGDENAIEQHIEWCVYKQDIAFVRKWDVEWHVGENT